MKKQSSNWLPFKEALTFTHGLGLKTKDEWIKWAKSDARPDDIPTKPSRTYKDKGWVGWGDCHLFPCSNGNQLPGLSPRSLSCTEIRRFAKDCRAYKSLVRETIGFTHADY